ncbi:MAG: virulence factor [Arenicellales bacterium]
MPNLIIIYWRDIPAQVMAKQGRNRVRHQLSNRFQIAIDRAAMRAKKIDADAYIDDWQRVNEKIAGEMEAIVKAKTAEIESAYSDELLERIIKNKGVTPALSIATS